MFKQLQRCMSGLKVEEAHLEAAALVHIIHYILYIVLVATSWKHDEEDYYHFLTLHLHFFQFSWI